jgi:pterin-4a-carbinolamine dehydratase
MTYLASVNRVAADAGEAGHYPETHLAWGQVDVIISTAAEGEFTERDFTLTAGVDQSYWMCE